MSTTERCRSTIRDYRHPSGAFERLFFTQCVPFEVIIVEKELVLFSRLPTELQQPSFSNFLNIIVFIFGASRYNSFALPKNETYRQWLLKQSLHSFLIVNRKSLRIERRVLSPILRSPIFRKSWLTVFIESIETPLTMVRFSKLYSISLSALGKVRNENPDFIHHES